MKLLQFWREYIPFFLIWKKEYVFSNYTFPTFAFMFTQVPQTMDYSFMEYSFTVFFPHPSACF